MALNGTITVSTCGGTSVTFSTAAGSRFRAKSLYIYNLTAGNSAYLDISTTTGATTGFTIPPSTLMSFPQLGGISGFSVIASSAAGSLSLSYLASR